MQTKKLNKLIADAIAHEENTRTLATLIRQYTQLQGKRLTAAEINSGVAFIQSYVQHAPALLKNIESAAQKAGIADEVASIVSTAEQYFLAPVDLIPDHLGLVGLMDDAYLAHRLVEGVCDRYTQQTGEALLSLDVDDFRKVNGVIRGLVGEPMASQLDLAVQGSLGMPSIQQALGQLMHFGSSLPMGPDPIWGNASVSEVANARLGAMGVV